MVRNCALLYIGCGMVCVYLNEVGKMSTAQLGLVMLYAAQLQRAAMEHMMTLTQVETQVSLPLFFSERTTPPLTLRLLLPSRDTGFPPPFLQ